MAASEHLEVLLVSLGSTAGLRLADEQLCDALRAAGADARLTRATPPRPVRTMALTDLAWARAARDATRRVLRERAGAGAGPGGRAPAVIYSSTTAALLWPLPGAIRFDACAAANRPGRHGLWQRPAERRRLASSPLLLPWSEGALDECAAAAAGSRSLVVPVAVESSGPLLPPPARDIAAVTYAANPLKKGFDRVLAAWRSLRGEPGRELLVAGTDEHELRRAGIPVPAAAEGVRLLGRLPADEYRGLLRRARVFVCAPRREDYGIAQLEALADGCMLVTTPAPGPYVALAPARALDARLVGEDLVAGLRAALEEPRPGYAEDAALALAPFSGAALADVVAGELLPRLSSFR